MWPTHDGPKILVVDDYDNLRKLVATFLSRHGYTVLEAADGGTAIQIAIAETPKFILLDIFLPDMNGMEVARQLRQSLTLQAHPNCRLVRNSDTARASPFKGQPN